MKPSEMIRKLIASMTPTVGNQIYRKLLVEIADEVDKLQAENDRLNEILRGGGL